MGDLVVIYDPVKQIGAIVDTDSRCGFGPADIGEDAGINLEVFLSTIPYDASKLSSYDLRDWFAQFQERAATEPPPVAAAADISAVEPPRYSGGTDGAALAVAEAVNTPATPAAAPADSDMGADQGEADTVSVGGYPIAADVAANVPTVPLVEQTCPVCNGSGNVPGSEPNSVAVCNLCQGTGRTMLPAAS